MAAALALAVGFAALAQAQQVLVMSEERILRESAVGQHIATELQRIGQEIQAELAPLGQSIQQENEALTAETSALSEEAIRQRPDLLSRLQTLQQDAQQFELRRRQAQQEIVATERAAMQPVLETLQGVLQEIVQERGAAVLLDRSAVVYAGESIDITAAAIERLNQRIATTPVNRVRLPQQGQGGAAQQ
ncbi:MAG: OmpH family outer membrane protein [Alphaproteobacteria bacterium]|nr:OmpH family outer membrane protein [Alphaproteobacteria bacterium]